MVVADSGKTKGKDKERKRPCPRVGGAGALAYGMGWQAAPDGADRCCGGPSATPPLPRHLRRLRCPGQAKGQRLWRRYRHQRGMPAGWPRGPGQHCPSSSRLPQQPAPLRPSWQQGGLAQLPVPKGAPWWGRAEAPAPASGVPRSVGGPWHHRGTHRPHTWAVPSSASSPSPSRGGGGGVRQGSVPPGGGKRLCPPRTVQPEV